MDPTPMETVRPLIFDWIETELRDGIPPMFLIVALAAEVGGDTPIDDYPQE